MNAALLNNRYRLLNPLGKGGFGETFLAEDTHMPSGRRCVIKKLQPVTNNSEVYQIVQERFQREAAILEELGEEHKQIPCLYAYFTEQGQFYLVQEWIQGQTLTKLLQEQGGVKESEVRKILVKILPVLDYIHSKRIVHRDIKPDNIILRQADDLPVLIDFGAVKETMGTVVNSQGNTTSSIVIGTPGFMPSEQAAGRPVYSSDLYSLGLVAVYLLTGKTPQELETDPRSGEIIWRSFAPEISSQFAEVIDRAIQSHPRDRFPMAVEMLNALQPSQTTVASPSPAFPPTVQVAPSAPPETAPTVASSPPQNSKRNLGLSIIVAALIVSVLIGGSVVGGLMMIRSEGEETASTTENEQTQQETTEDSPKPAPAEPSPSPPEVSAANNPEPPPPQSPSPEPPSQQSPEPPPPPPNRTEPSQVVRNYYENVNGGQYLDSWTSLSQEIRNDSKLHPQGYTSYQNWWETVNFVDVREVNLVDSSADNATVDARLAYNMNDGSVTPQSLRFSLIWDENQQRWIFNKIRVR